MVMIGLDGVGGFTGGLMPLTFRYACATFSCK